MLVVVKRFNDKGELLNEENIPNVKVIKFKSYSHADIATTDDIKEVTLGLDDYLIIS